MFITSDADTTARPVDPSRRRVLMLIFVVATSRCQSSRSRSRGHIGKHANAPTCPVNNLPGHQKVIIASHTCQVSAQEEQAEEEQAQEASLSSEVGPFPGHRLPFAQRS